MKIFERLNKYIKDNGIKQSFISEKTDIPVNTLSMILNGKVKLDADRLEDILIALNLNANEIFKKTTPEISDTNLHKI